MTLGCKPCVSFRLTRDHNWELSFLRARSGCDVGPVFRTSSLVVSFGSRELYRRQHREILGPRRCDPEHRAPCEIFHHHPMSLTDSRFVARTAESVSRSACNPRRPRSGPGTAAVMATTIEHETRERGQGCSRFRDRARSDLGPHSSKIDAERQRSQTPPAHDRVARRRPRPTSRGRFVRRRR